MGEQGKYALLVLSLLVSLANTLLRNSFSKKYAGSGTDYHWFNAVSSLVSMAALLGISGVASELSVPSGFTILLAVLYGALTAAATLLSLFALKLGSMSYTAVIGTSSMIIPALSGLVFWGEPVSAGQFSGIFLMLLSFVFAIGNKQGDKKASLKWFAMCMSAALLSGMIGILQKVHQSSAFSSELNMFLILSFLVSFLVSLGQYIWSRRVRRIPQTVRFSLRSPSFLFGIAGGLCVALVNQINLYLAGALPSIVFFPIVNGAGLLLSVAAGVVFLKERFTGKQKIGIVLGMFSVLLLCNIF